MSWLYGGDHPQLLVTEGDDGTTFLSDVWLLDLQSGRWREVRVDECVRLGMYGCLTCSQGGEG